MEVHNECNYNDILKGTLDSLPRLPSTSVRVFLSSTFADYYIERNELMRTTFPKIREICSQKGLDFQVLDMRWGINEIASDDHMISKICVDQIRMCQEISSGPTLLVFLGQRYGFRPIPSSIESREFRFFLQILAELDTDQQELSLLTDWYKEDLNAVPASFRLREISHIINDYRSSDQQKKTSATAIWNTTYKRIRSTLRVAADEAYQRRQLSKEKWHVYFRSVTEEEVWHGLLSPDRKLVNPGAMENKALCFRREFEPINMDISEYTPRMKKYFDTLDGKEDVDGKSLLQDLKYTKIPNVLPTHRIYNYFNVQWSPQGINPSIHDHRQYLDRFCSDVEIGLMDQIDIAQSSPNSMCVDQSDTYASSELIKEILLHSNICNKKLKTFAGRERTIEKVRTRLLQSDCPLIIHGISGVGKSSVMAKIIDQLPVWLGSNTIRIFRFLRSSLSSTLLYDVLDSVIKQLAACDLLEALSEEEEEEIWGNSTNLANYFARICLGMGVKAEVPIVIAIDAIDGLKALEGARFMSWLPSALAPNVKIIISVISGEENCGCYETLMAKLSDDESFIQVDALTTISALEITQNLLRRRNRTLTQHQFKVLAKTLFEAPILSPLLISLISREVSKWRSYHHPADKRLEYVLEKAIHVLFDEMEYNHGKLFTSHAMAYLTASKRGLSDLEMEDLLSLDNDVLKEVYWIQKPPNETKIRVAGSLWQRLQYDLDLYLSTKFVDGRHLVCWTYQQLRKVAVERYVPTEYHTKYRLNSEIVHTHLAHYFGDHYSERDIILPVKIKLEGQDLIYDGNRNIARQPLQYAEDTYNYRRLQEYPYHLIKSWQLSLLFDSVLLNPDWIKTKIEACGLQDTIYDFSVYIERRENVGIKEIFNALLSMTTTDFENFETYLCARLLEYRNIYPDTVGKLLDRVEERCEKSGIASLIPLTGYAGNADHLHKTFLRNSDDFVGLLATRREMFVLNKDWDLTVYHVIQGDIVRQVKLGHLKPDLITKVDLIFSESFSKFYIITRLAGEKETQLRVLCFDTINLVYEDNWSKSFSTVKDFLGDIELYGASRFITVKETHTDYDITSVSVLLLPKLETRREVYLSDHTTLLGIAQNKYLLMMEANVDEGTTKAHVYNLLEEKEEKVVLQLSKSPGPRNTVLPTNDGLLFGECRYSELLAETRSSIVEIYDYKLSGRTKREIPVPLTPTKLSAIDKYLAVHYPWHTSIYDLTTLDQKLIITDVREIVHIDAAFNHIFLMDADGVARFYNLETRNLVKHWYSGLDPADSEQLKFCRSRLTGKLYVIQVFSSIVKVWKPKNREEIRASLAPITSLAIVSASHKFCVYQRRDFSVYKTELTSGSKERLSCSRSIVSIATSSNGKYIAIKELRFLRREVSIKLFGVNDAGENFERPFIIPIDYPEFWSQFNSGINKTQDAGIFGMTRSEPLIVTQLYISRQDSIICLVNIPTGQITKIKAITSFKKQRFVPILEGDVIHYGEKHGPTCQYVHFDVAQNKLCKLSWPESVPYNPEKYYLWQASIHNYLILVDSVCDIDRINVQNYTKSRFRRPSERKVSFSYIDASECCINVLFNDGRHSIVNINSTIRNIFCHARMMVVVSEDGGLVQADLATGQTHESRVEWVYPETIITSTESGSILIYYDKLSCDLGIVSATDASLLCKLNIQGDSYHLSDTYLSSIGNLERLVLACDGGADVAIFRPNQKLKDEIKSMKHFPGLNGSASNDGYSTVCVKKQPTLFEKYCTII